MRGTVCGCGSDATDAALSGHPPDRSEHRFLSAAGSGRLPSVRCGGRPFGTTAEVHPAKFIQLRLQLVYSALPVAQLFPARAWINASCSARRCFSRRMSSEEVSFISPHFTRLILQQPGIKRPTAWSGRSATASAVASRCLPTTLPAAPVSGTLCHRGLTARRSARAPAVWSAGTARLR